MTRAEAVGRRVLQAFARGRQIAIAKAQKRSRLVLNDLLVLMELDIQAGRDSRTRAARLSRKLGVTAKTVRKLLRTRSSAGSSQGGTVRAKQEALCTTR